MSCTAVMSNTCRFSATTALQRRTQAAGNSLIAPCLPVRSGAARRQQHAANVTARRVATAAVKVEKVNGEQLEVEIASRTTSLIIDFYATWCGPCVLLAEELKKIAEEYEGKVKVLKVDVDENQDLASMLKIQGLPTMVFIPKENGKPALRTEGLMPAEQIKEVISSHL